MKILTRQEEQILLAIYHLEEKAYLVSIREQIKNYTGKYFSVGTIYAPLNRLCLSGIIESYLGEPNAIRGGKAIKYYKLTKMGFEALTEIKRQHDLMWQNVNLPAFGSEV